ncbi:MAG: hypothetical protein ABIN89_31220 [Chitinophagaceae bacterium]
MVLGVGFYGYGFGPTLFSPATSMNVGDILLKFPGSENMDQLTMPDSSNLTYTIMEFNYQTENYFGKGDGFRNNDMANTW